MTRHQKGFVSMRVKLLMAFTLVFTVFYLAIFGAFYLHSTDLAMERIREDMVSTLRGGLQGIDGDTFEALSQLEAAPGTFPDDPRYVAHQNWLTQIHELEPRAYPYTLRRAAQPREGLWVGDILRVVRAPGATTWLESYVNPESKLFDGFETLTTNTVPYTDKWGSWVSAYAPIVNSRGQSVGVMGVDFEANYVYKVQNGIFLTLLPTFAITFISLLIAIFFVSRALTKPIQRLTEAAEELGEGNYARADKELEAIHKRDEIGVLAAVFRTMTDKVRSREEHLTRKVEELSIQIDVARREKQVAEVTESEFFQDLQARVKLIRSRKQSERLEPAVQG